MTKSTSHPTSCSPYFARFNSCANLRAPRGARHQGRAPKGRVSHISIHAPAWGATAIRPHLSLLVQISIHAPAWGATFRLLCAPSLIDISIHAPAWGATPVADPSCAQHRISIHAPAWGATNPFEPFIHETEISIHAPAWGATRPSSAQSPRPFISIHAPAWGATCCGCIGYQSLAISIHAPAWGATVFIFRQHPVCRISIHAPAWGATSPRVHTHSLYPDFNPRARVGRDNGFSVESFQFVISIHAPAWGATHQGDGRSNGEIISIHAPAWGATCRLFGRQVLHIISIHAPAWGATVPVYTGLITAVALYFSRTSFWPCCYRHFSSQSPLCDTGSHRDFAAILAKEMPATASEFLQLHNLVLHRRAAFFLRIYFPSYKNAGCLFLGQSNLSTHAAGRRTALHRERIQTRSSARAVRGARSTSPLFSSVCGRQVFPY